MALVALRNIVGFLVQVVPCAVLCFVPFAHRLTDRPRRVYASIAAAIFVAAVPFVFVAASPLPQGLEPMRLTLQNLVFLALVAALVALFAVRVDAPAAQKAFVVLMVMSYGYFVTKTSSTVGDRLGVHDGYMYPPLSLLLLAVMNAVFLVPMVPLARYVRRLADTITDPRAWWRLGALPAGLLAIMIFCNWLPDTVLARDETYYVLIYALSAFAVFLFWYVLRIAETMQADARRRTKLEQALQRHRLTQRELEEQLGEARRRVDELERTLATRAGADDGAGDDETDGDAAALGAWDGEVVTLTGSSQAVSFLAGDLVYAESLKRTRTLHLEDGGSVTIDVALARMAELLPAGHFAFCHRSVLVNLHRVAFVEAADVVMDDGTRLPLSRRRASEFAAALEASRG